MDGNVSQNIENIQNSIPTGTATETTTSILESTTDTSDETIKPIEFQWEPTSQTTTGPETIDSFLRDVASNDISDSQTDTNEYANSTTNTEKKQKRRQKRPRGQQFKKPIHAVASLFRKKTQTPDGV